MKFESGPRTQNLPNIKFNNGILVIPFFTAFSSHTECLYRYVPAFENMHGCPRHFNDYFAIMYFLLRTPIDADILIQNGIIGLGDSEILSAALKRLRKYTLMVMISNMLMSLKIYRPTAKHRGIVGRQT